MITLKIDVTKILKQHLYTGKKGTYLELVVMENREGEDQYGNTHMVVQGLPKELREAGERGPILGNGKEFGQPRQQQREYSQRPAQQRGSAPSPRQQEQEDDDIPF